MKSLWFGVFGLEEVLWKHKDVWSVHIYTKALLATVTFSCCFGTGKQVFQLHLPAGSKSQMCVCVFSVCVCVCARKPVSSPPPLSSWNKKNVSSPLAAIQDSPWNYKSTRQGGGKRLTLAVFISESPEETGSAMSRE